MNNTEFDNTLKKLEGQVSKFSSVATDFEIPKNNSILSKIDLNLKAPPIKLNKNAMRKLERLALNAVY